MNELIINIVNICIVPILGVLVGYLCKYIKSKIDLVDSENVKNFLNESLNELQNAVDTAVNKVAQSYVDDLKKDGAFNVDEQKKAFNDAYNTVLQILSVDTIEFLNDRLTSDGFKTLIESKIEESVKLNKSETVLLTASA